MKKIDRFFFYTGFDQRLRLSVVAGKYQIEKMVSFI